MSEKSEKINLLIAKLEDFKTITEIIIKNEGSKSGVEISGKVYQYETILEKISNSLKKINEIKEVEDGYYFNLLDLDFILKIYCESNNSGNTNVNISNDYPFFKLHYYKLTLLNSSNNPNSIFSTKNQHLANMPWEHAFLQDHHKSLLESDFPYSAIRNNNGDIYKKYQSLLHILFWLDNAIVELHKNKKLTKSINEVYINREKIFKSINDMNSDNLNIFNKYVTNITEVDASIKLLSEKKELIENIENKSTEIDTLKTKIDELLKETKELNDNSKAISLGKMVDEISKTFEDSATFYNKSKDFKLWSILGIGLIFLACSGFLLWSFPLEEIVKLSDRPISLLVYLLSKFLIFIILGSLLTFLISEYKKDAKIALDFTHRKSIANVTPGFRKQVSNEENKEKFGMDAFNTLLEIPNTEKEEKTAKENYYLANVLKSLSDADKKDIWTIIKKEILVKLESKNKEDKNGK